ncbi:DNA methylase [Thermincola ferriacetica]|uniref:site-specific DNA-methyltransferase (cytosine-N(4)-specific) n=1 Tax=Thermincola ferriacetica TaxID=281456 RepID=A0A0L6W0P4_9FIRM|nr:DNA methyltransferase [Thermincola ferriacetica]KNZ68654.1 DNA methylase [Thermincola ferriacetica]
MGITNLNAICPYFTMFPLDFPLSILEQYGEGAQWVLDPFCGRGTTNFAARLHNCPSIGIDSSPVAVALTEAKLVNTTVTQIMRTADKILSKDIIPDIPQGEFWEHAFDYEVLSNICKIREALVKSCDSEARIALRAIMLGALHGPQSINSPSYFSNQCPRTYAPKPAYAVRFWKERNFKPLKVDILSIIKKRAERYYGQELPNGYGFVIKGDSTTGRVFARVKRVLDKHNAKVSMIITSPPYYGMKTYIADQWIRNWFLGGPDVVDYSTNGQIKHSGKEVFIKELRKVWNNTAEISSRNAILAIRFGSINDRKVNPEDVIKDSLSGTLWEIKEIRSAGFAKKGRRQADTFAEKNKEQIEEIDIIAVKRG